MFHTVDILKHFFVFQKIFIPKSLLFSFTFTGNFIFNEKFTNT